MRLLVGSRKGLFIYNDAFELEHRCFDGIPVQFAMRDARSGALWASLEHGHWGNKLSRSTDDGTTWDEVEAPRYPDDAVLKYNKKASTKLIWCIAEGGADHPERLWAGTEPGGLFRSDDGGDTWQLNEGLWNHSSRKPHWFGGGRDEPAIHSIVVDPRDSEHIYVGISCAGTFESHDGGDTWAPRNDGLSADFLPDPRAEVGQDPHLVVAAQSNPDVMWQQNHCGVYVSTDAGATWEDVSAPDDGVYFGFPVCVDHADPNTAWLAPGLSDECRITVDGGLFVARTTDGGKTWERLDEGLPKTECYDIVYRHAMDVHEDVLALGSTTGNLFISRDRGDSFETLSNYLPPIYSVRFAP